MYNKPTSVSYIDAGFNRFFSRSISSDKSNSLQQISQTAGTKNINFDHYSTSGSLGDKIQIGGIVIDGNEERISFNDNGTEISSFGNNNGTYSLLFNNAGGKTVSENTGSTETKYNDNGSIYYRAGELPDGSYGVAFYNSNGVMISKMDGTTDTRYDSLGAVISESTGTKTIYYDATDARILIGQSPDASRVGVWVSKLGEDVVGLL